MRAQRTRSLKAALALLVALVPAVLLVQALLLGLSVEPVAHGQEVAGKGLLTLLWARLFRMTRGVPTLLWGRLSRMALSLWHAGLGRRGLVGVVVVSSDGEAEAGATSTTPLDCRSGRSLFSRPTSLVPSSSLTISTGGSSDSGQAASRVVTM